MKVRHFCESATGKPSEKKETQENMTVRPSFCGFRQVHGLLHLFSVVRKVDKSLYSKEVLRNYTADPILPSVIVPVRKVLKRTVAGDSD